MTMLQIESLSKHFTLHLRGGLQLPVLQGVSLEVQAGECVALLSAFASRMARAHVALILAAVLTLFCVGVFVYGLGLPIPLVGRWLQGQ